MEPEQSADRPRRGLGQRFGSLLGASADLANARVSLLLIEAAEARDAFSVVSRFATAGLIAIASGYTLLLAGLAHLAAEHWFGGRIILPMAGLAGIHLLAGVVLLAATRARLRRARLFEETLQQFQNDRRWLDQIHTDLRKSS